MTSLNTGPIVLAQEEALLLSQITFGELNHATAARNGDNVAKLIDKLVAREAIPEVRRKYFTDPHYSGGPRGKSKQGMFEGDGTRGRDIFRHPHFLEYLHYFLFGAKLPPVVITAFVSKVEDCGNVTSGDVDPLCKLAKQLVRANHLNPHEAFEEFYRLALDCDLSPDYADFVRRAVRDIR